MGDQKVAAPDPLETGISVQPVGEHVVTFEPPDLFHSVMNGGITQPDLNGLLTFVEHHAIGRPHLFVIVDIAKLGGIAPEVRRGAGVLSKTLPYRGMAFYGASFQARIFVTLLMGAMKLFSSNDNPAYFAKSQEEARKWIQERRKIVAASVAR